MEAKAIDIMHQFGLNYI